MTNSFDKKLKEMCAEEDQFKLHTDDIKDAVSGIVNVEISLNLDRLDIILEDLGVKHSSSKRILYGIFDKGHDLGNTNFLIDTAKKVILLYQGGFSNSVIETKFMLDYTISERGYINGYMGLQYFRENEVDNFIEAELKRRGLNDERISDVVTSKALRKYLEEYNVNPEDPDFEACGHEEFLLSIEQKKELFLSCIDDVLELI